MPDLLTESGLEAAFLAHHSALRRFLQARGAGDAAEDVLQELWLRLQGVQAGQIANPTAYLYRAANNLMHDRNRSMVSARQRDEAWFHAQTSQLGVSDIPMPDRVLEAREQLRQIEAVLAAEGERVVTVFRRARLENEPHKQIAAALGISLSAVEKDLQKAYRALIAWRRDQDAD